MATRNEPYSFTANYGRNWFEEFHSQYYTLLNIVSPLIIKQDTQMTKAITAHERLSLTLRFLASGNSYEDLQFLIRNSIE